MIQRGLYITSKCAVFHILKDCLSFVFVLFLMELLLKSYPMFHQHMPIMEPNTTDVISQLQDLKLFLSKKPKQSREEFQHTGPCQEKNNLILNSHSCSLPTASWWLQLLVLSQHQFWYYHRAGLRLHSHKLNCKCAFICSNSVKFQSSLQSYRHNNQCKGKDRCTHPGARTWESAVTV